MNLDELAAAAQAELAQVSTAEQLETFRIKYLGTKGKLKEASDHLRDVPKEEKRAYGQKLNETKGAIAAAYEAKEKEIAAGGKGGGKDGGVTVDITEPAPLGFTKYEPGVAHIITQTIDELTNLFGRMGFTVAEGPEVEDDFHNFIALNIPASHPARDPLDNFYLKRAGLEGESREVPAFMLRSQTSSVQIRVMESQKPPIRIVAPGRVYRPDTVDATHLFMFYQLEALVIDKGVTMVDMRTAIDQFAKAYFGAGVETRFRPSFFPFTEPSAEVDVLMHLPDGTTKWMEVGGCGMVDPNVLKAVGIDPEVYSGWAFGFGIERLLMRKHGITDIRDLVANDLRFLRQF